MRPRAVPLSARGAPVYTPRTVMRFITPVLFLAAAGYVYWYNQNHLDRLVLAFVFDLLVPSSKGDLVAQGRYTVMTLAGVGVLYLIRDIIWYLRENRGVR